MSAPERLEPSQPHVVPVVRGEQVVNGGERSICVASGIRA
jgi:hypothetical protein